MSAQPAEVTTLLTLIDKAEDAVYAVENTRHGCSECDAMARRYGRSRLEELAAARRFLTEGAAR